MRVLGHRAIRGATIHRDGPVDRLVISERKGEGVRVQAALGDRAGPDGGLGPIVAHVALALRAAAGKEATWSKTWQDADGDWIILMEAQDEHEARAAAQEAVAIARAILDDESDDLEVRWQRSIDAVRAARASNSTARLLERAATARQIPVTVLGPDHIQLGWGVRRRTFWGSMSDRTSGLGHEIANDHERSKEVLQERGIPLPDFEAVRTLRGAEEVAQDLRYPVAVKPLRGQGGVTPYVGQESDLESAYDKAKQHHRWIVVEDHVRGHPHRILVHDGEVVAAIQEGDPPVDVLNILHPAVRLVASRAARIAGIDLVAIDVIAERLDVPLDETRGKVVGMEPCPDLAAFPGGDRVAQALVARSVEGDGRIPLVGVTGTNGKTTTVRLISHILKFSGGRVGMACTGAIEVENQVTLRGDYSGPGAARAVLREPGVTHAVCEVARGGLLQRGLGFDRCDVAVFLNVGSDHLGEGGIETIEDLARLKGVVARAANTVVANADDPHVWAQRGDWEQVIPFSLDPANPALQAHLDADPANVVVTLEHDTVVLKRGPATFQVCPVIEIPITLQGAARFNIQNAMAAVAATYAIGASEEDTRAALRSFNPSMGQLPGRMNLVSLGGVKILLDYGHNVPALEALAETLPRLSQGRRINVANASGNRRDEDLRAFGKAIAGMYDRIYLCDPDPRKRVRGATAAVIQDGVADAGFDMDAFTLELDEGKALKMALAESRPGDLVVLQADDVEGAIRLINDLRSRLEAGEDPARLNQELLA